MKSTTQLIKAWNRCLKHPKWLVYAAVMDIISATSLSAALTSIWIIIIDSLTKVYDIMDKMPMMELVDGSMLPEAVQQQALLNVQYTEIMQWGSILFVAFFGIWVTFQGGAWWIAHIVAKGDVEAKYFIPRFLLITLFAQIVGFLLVTGMGIINAFSGPVQIDALFTAPLLFIGGAVIFYLQHVAYAVIGNTPFYPVLRTAVWVKARKMIPAYLIIGIGIGLINYLAVWLLSLDILLGVLLSALLVAPAYTFFRVYLIYMVKSVKR